MSLGSCAAVLKTASRANPAVHLPYRPRARVTPRTASRNVSRYDWIASSGSVVANDPVNMTDPDGKEGACMYSPGMCGLRELTPQQQKERDEAYKMAGTAVLVGASFLPVGRAVSWVGRALGIGRAASAVERANIAAASFKAVAAKAGTTPTAVGEMVGWGGGRTAATQAAARTAEIDKVAVAGMREAGLTKTLATSARDMYRAAAETGMKGGEVAIERAKLMEKIIKNW
jgi:hypothetical protein